MPTADRDLLTECREAAERVAPWMAAEGWHWITLRRTVIEAIPCSSPDGWTLGLRIVSGESNYGVSGAWVDPDDREDGARAEGPRLAPALAFVAAELRAELVARGLAEPETYDVVLRSYRDRKVPVIQAIRYRVPLDLRGLKALVESAPCVVLTGVSFTVADEVRTRIEEAGGLAAVIPTGAAPAETTPAEAGEWHPPTAGPDPDADCDDPDATIDD